LTLLGTETEPDVTSGRIICSKITPVFGSIYLLFVGISGAYLFCSNSTDRLGSAETDVDLLNVYLFDIRSGSRSSKINFYEVGRSS
jgi:hypothetical protein